MVIIVVRTMTIKMFSVVLFISQESLGFVMHSRFRVVCILRNNNAKIVKKLGNTK